MTTLATGTRAPLFSLATSDGSRKNLAETLRNNPLVVLFFFKVSCPVCQFSAPYMERIHKNYPAVPVWGISQDDAVATNEFVRAHGASFPVVLDEKLESTVEYDLTNVPTVFLVRSDGTIGQVIMGFAKSDFQNLNSAIARISGADEKTLFTDDDDVPALRPG